MLAIGAILLAMVPIGIAITMPEWFDHEGDNAPRYHPFPAIGMSIIHADKGFFVGRIEKGSPAAQTDLAVGDQIIAIDHVEIGTALSRSTRQFGCQTHIDYVTHGERRSTQFDQCER
ncbi:PDZ domain-containing protein [Aurantiacibacter rhizosphaerae]|uniref:PDZ domain-containing protein n=1 Tax=Aurantiacibacter rhizosphaerae TaxID=2691582 RepID=A0A844XHN7_9SPHN|nr:PDZ domain-containing protein [Aurantiacibacter rhizosphaerae]MWV29249.1 PDZ domain-containing protein [Aurantiacibacter rhizosphaerae]